MFLTFCSPIGSKTEREFRFNLLRHLSGNADAARVGNLLEAGCDVDTVAMPVGSLHDHFAEVDSNANIDPLILRLAGVSLCHSSLDIDRALNCVDDANQAKSQRQTLYRQVRDRCPSL